MFRAFFTMNYIQKVWGWKLSWASSSNRDNGNVVWLFRINYGTLKLQVDVDCNRLSLSKKLLWKSFVKLLVNFIQKCFSWNINSFFAKVIPKFFVKSFFLWSFLKWKVYLLRMLTVLLFTMYKFDTDVLFNVLPR